ncbi:M20 family metallopeptidase [Vagococcus vulneris]|uniref:Amidohydrolase n=1 Tax=Vagococcus vulneris TaxID=1977869 RepID=A0A429ZPA2_9ENTE|nr:M20 family metallopeptidase [Vagococcus vulneris]RST95511.1 amidohydrolase [Vagococcus vulneris]
MNDLQKELQKRLKSKEKKMIEIRRYLHEHPELSFQEKKTSQYIVNFYTGKDCKIHTNFGGGYGILIDIDGGKPGPSLALRADFDALPIQEETNLSFASKNPGVMHACGHDGHTAYMLILGETLIELKDQLPGKIRIIHQPAEETPPGGALGMVKAGCLDGYDHVLGAHLMTTINLGEVAYREGETMSGRTNFKLVMHGKSGHGSMPQDANDTIVAAAQFVTAVQTIVSRRINPFDMAVITIGSFDGKGSANVIKDQVELVGDIRVMTEHSRKVIETEFKRILAGICEAYNIDYELEYIHDYPVLVNDPQLTRLVVEATQNAAFDDVTSITETPPVAASEDFAYYAQEKPSCFFFIGCTKKGDDFYPHHHPKFMVNEDALLIASEVMGNATLEYLLKGGC